MSDGPIHTIPPDWISSEVFALAPSNLWHLPRSVWDVIWAKVTGDQINVAILDTGMNSHPDLPEPIKAESFVSGQSWRDGNGHGTHCAGTAIGRNGIGVAPKANLLVGKVLSNGGSGGSDGISRGIRWAADNGADVISMSLGSGSPYEPNRTAILYAMEKGSIVVAAAGNSGFNGSRNTIGWPGKYLESICVGATRSDGKIASFSSGGREMDVACPGQDIVSASTNRGYVSMSGTSMATPFFAGLLALVIELMRREGNARFTGVEAVRAFLAQYCEDKGTPGKDPSFGLGVPIATKIVGALSNDDITFV
jgi:subtilisin family serine protease